MPNQSFTDSVLYGRPRPCRTKSESQASTSQLRQADRRQGKRKALARPSSARANAGRSQGSPPGQTPATTPPADRRQGKRKALARPNSAKANAGHPPDQTAPEQSQGAPKAAHQGKLPPQLRQADRCQGKRKALARPSSAKAIAGHSPGQATPRQAPAEQTPTKANSRHNSAKQTGAKARAGRSLDQAAPGIQTEIASLNGDRRFQLQRSGTISSGPLKKLRVSCVHERDGKQVPCVRSLCSYARESRAC